MAKYSDLDRPQLVPNKMLLTSKPLLLILALIFPCCNSSGKIERGLLDFLFSPCKCRCGVPNREARFHGGEFLRGHEFPWAALVQTHVEGGPESVKTVPGALINNKYIITGAAPLTGLTPYLVKVTLGAYDRCIPDISSANFSVEDIIIHPDFSPENHANDIALLKLSSPVLFERRVSPICLAVPGNTYLGQVATIVGWPKDVGAKAASCRPKKLGLPVLGNECLEATPAPDSLTSDKGCIGLVGTNSVVCQEDAGVPVMYRSHGGIYELIGILTSQNKCDNAKSAGFYTRVNSHLSWIIQNTRDACYCVKT